MFKPLSSYSCLSAGLLVVAGASLTSEASAVEIFADSFDDTAAGDGAGRRAFAMPWNVEFGYRSDAGVGTQPSENTTTPNAMFFEVQNQNSNGFRPDPNSPQSGPLVGGAALNIDTGAAAAAGRYELIYDAIRRQSFDYDGVFTTELYAWDGVGSIVDDGTQIDSGVVGSIPTGTPGSTPNMADFSLASDLAGSVHIRFSATGSSGSGTDPSDTNYKQFLIDTVSVNFNPIPEPGSLTLAGLAGTALLARRRRTNG